MKRIEAGLREMKGGEGQENANLFTIMDARLEVSLLEPWMKGGF